MRRSIPSWRASAAALAVCLAALALGCWQSAPPPPPAPATPVAAPPELAPVEEPDDGAAEESTDPSVDAAADDEMAGSAAGSDSESVSQPDEPQASSERILLLGPRGPLIVEFQFTIDGRPHVEALEQLVDEVLELARDEADGRPTWAALCAHPRIKYGQFGNLPIDGENGEKQIVERYDVNRNGLIERSELPRFLTRNAGGSRSFSIRGTADNRSLNRRGAPTWQVIDADGDGAISAAERAAAALRLASRDTDDDEILLPADLNPRLAAMEMGMVTQRRRRGPDAARLLGPHADWGAVRLALENQYGGSRSLRPDCFPLTPELFGQLDANGDERLTRDEFPALNDVPAHVVVAVEFGRREPGDGSRESGDGGRETGDGQQEKVDVGPKMRVVRVAEGLMESGEGVVEQPGRLTLQLAGMTLTFYTNDTVAADDFEARARQALAMYDANKDGYLEPGEISEAAQAQLARFEALDADGDGKVYLGEIEAFLRQQQAGLRAQIHAKAGDQDDLLFAVLDANGDGRLDSRELEQAAERLAALDTDGDGLVTPDELPEAMVIGLARGSLENADTLFTPPPAAARPTGEAPRWFTAMDANRDGVISRREFVGTSEQFAALDADGNGLIELHEALSADSKDATDLP